MDLFEEISDNVGYEKLLKIMQSIPSCIFFKDKDLRYQLTTQHWEQLGSENIIGKTDLEIRKDIDNAKLAMEADRNIINTGKGCSYVIKSDIDGHVSYLELIKEPVFDDFGECIGIVGLINDVTSRVLAEQQLKETSSTDALTKLYNRKAGVELIEEKLKENINKNFLLLDLDKFKHINDTYGHQVGDSLLKEFAKVIKRNTGKDDVAMRLGGDEFIIFINRGGKIDDYIHKLIEDIDNIRVEGVKEKISASIGIAHVKAGDNFDTLYAKSDRVMYIAKKTDITSFVYY